MVNQTYFYMYIHELYDHLWYRHNTVYTRVSVLGRTMPKFIADKIAVSL